MLAPSAPWCSDGIVPELAARVSASPERWVTNRPTCTHTATTSCVSAQTPSFLPPFPLTPDAPHRLANLNSRASARLTTWLRVMRKLKRESAMATNSHTHEQPVSKKRPSAVLTHVLANLIRRCPASAWSTLGEADDDVGTSGNLGDVGGSGDGGGNGDFVAVGEALPLVFALVDDFDPTIHSVGGAGALTTATNYPATLLSALILAIILTHTVAIIRHLGGLITPPADYSACSSHGPHMPPCYSD